jgi:alpha-L-fucosidase
LLATGVIQKHKFEDPTTMDKNGWSHRKIMNLEEVHTMDELTELLASVVRYCSVFTNTVMQ